jgi:hypothetical protein
MEKLACRICSKSGLRRAGGTVGLCWQHLRRKCLVCGRASAGKQTCTACDNAADVERWKARATFRAYDWDRQMEFADARREKLWESKRHFHEAVEVLFQGLFYALQAIWGMAPRAEREPVGKAA